MPNLYICPMRTPVNNLLIEMEEAFQETITTPGGLKLYIDTTFNPENHTTIKGKVVGIPDKMSKDPFFDFPPEVQVGDTLIFNYLVVFSRTEKTDIEAFFQTEDMMWQNGLGQVITMGQAPNPFNGKSIWVGQLEDKEGEIIDLFSGKRDEVEKWVQSFKHTRNEDLQYEYHLEDKIWQVPYSFALAYVRDGKMVPIGGNVFLEPVQVPLALTFEGTSIIIPESLKQAEKKGAGIVKHIGTPRNSFPLLDAKEGDEVIFDPKYYERYKIQGKEYIIVKQHRLYAKTSKDGNSSGIQHAI